MTAHQALVLREAPTRTVNTMLDAAFYRAKAAKCFALANIAKYESQARALRIMAQNNLELADILRVGELPVVANKVTH